MKATEIERFQKALQPEKVQKITVDLVDYMESADKLVRMATQAVIHDVKTYATGGDLIKIARTQSAKAEEHRTELVGPFNKLVKFVNTAFKAPKERFTDARSIIEAKMLTWKAEEDKKLRVEAEKEKLRLEEEALARAALEKTEDAQDEVLDAAADAGKEVVEKAGVGLKRGDYGSSTGTRKTYETKITSPIDFLRALIQHIDAGNERDISLMGIVELKKSGLNKLAEVSFKAGVRKMPGAVFTEKDNIRVY